MIDNVLKFAGFIRNHAPIFYYGVDEFDKEDSEILTAMFTAIDNLYYHELKTEVYSVDSKDYFTLFKKKKFMFNKNKLDTCDTLFLTKGYDGCIVDFNGYNLKITYKGITSKIEYDNGECWQKQDLLFPSFEGFKAHDVIYKRVVEKKDELFVNNIEVFGFAIFKKLEEEKEGLDSLLRNCMNSLFKSFLNNFSKIIPSDNVRIEEGVNGFRTAKENLISVFHYLNEELKKA